jgi:radical SAM superfamily enzyme YgiQ (UPF0313 family)
MKAIKDVQLIAPPISDKYYGVSRSKDFPPLGLLSIATYLKNKIPDVEVEILDGEILSLKEIENRIKGNVVGIGVNILNYINALELARIAKENGATVALGGAHATALADVILKNRDYVDAVVLAEGEVAVLDIVKGKPFHKINNIAYLKANKINRTSIHLLNLDLLPSIDRALVDQKIYYNSFQKQRPWTRFKRPALIYSQKGCVWRMKTGGCLFCGRMDGKWRFRTPKKVWEEISQLVKQDGIDYINDVSSSITGNRNWLRRFCEEKPLNINPAFEVYACVHEIDEEVINLFDTLNVYKVFIGIESGNNTMLKSIGKPPLTEYHLKLANTLSNKGIKLTLGVVIGAPGETENSFRETIEHVKRIVEIGNVETISCSILVPVPGSPAYKMLLQHKKTGKKYINRDDLDAIELEEDWLNSFCSIDYRIAQEAVEEILKLAPLRSSMAMPKQNC